MVWISPLNISSAAERQLVVLRVNKSCCFQATEIENYAEAGSSIAPSLMLFRGFLCQKCAGEGEKSQGKSNVKFPVGC